MFAFYINSLLIKPIFLLLCKGRWSRYIASPQQKRQTTIEKVPASSSKSELDTLKLVKSALPLLREGSDALWYGIDATATNLFDSQDLLFAKIKSWLTANGASLSSVVLSGPSLSRLADDLQANGLQIVNLSQSAFDFARPADTAIIEGSLKGDDQLAVFTLVRKMLHEGGRFYFIGEHIDNDSDIGFSALANLSSFNQLATRLGFELLRREDFSKGALRSIELLLRELDALAADVKNSLSWDDDRFDAAVAQFKVMADEFKTGRRCFSLFEFSKSLSKGDDNVHAVYGDINSFKPMQLAQLFEDSFGSKFDPDLWAWKYQPGKGTCVVAREQEGGEIVSHYGGAPREIYYFGDKSLALQSCDVMVAPKLRRHYGKKSLFFKTAATFLEREEGNCNKHLLGFGFPNQSAMNIALRSGLYEKTDDFVEVIYPAGSELLESLEFNELDINDQSHVKAIDSLWEKMREDFTQGVIGVRDAAYIRYRYFEHPFANRGLLTRILINDRQTGGALAIVVLRDHEDKRLLLDLVCSAEKLKFMLQALSDHVSIKENKSLKFWIAQGWLDSVQFEGCTVNELGIEIPCNSWNPGPSAERLCGAWWLTAGDMDFV